MECWQSTSVLLWILSVYIFCYSAQDACSGLCSCKDHRHVYCVKLNLSYIPRIPNTTLKFTFEGNYLPVISNETLKNISHVNLIQISFSNNSIHTIDLNTLRYFTRLNRLILSFNPLSNQSLYNVMIDLSYNVYHFGTLSLSGIGLKVIPKNLFNIMGRYGTSLHFLDLSLNFLEKFDFLDIRSLNGLQNLNLGYNRLESIKFENKTYLHRLTIQANGFRNLPNFCWETNFTFFPNLDKLNIMNNTIVDFIPKHLNCLKKLRQLIISSNSIGIIKTNSFHHLKLLIKLDLSFQENPQIADLKLEKFAFNNSNLQNIMLKSSIMKIKNIHNLAFAGCSNLKMLILSNNELSDGFTTTCYKLDTILNLIPSLQHLQLGGCSLHRIPQVVSNLTDLISLNLQQNHIVSWTQNWTHNKKLTHLYLSSNKIFSVNTEMFPYSFRHQLKHVSFGGNILQCICDNVWFVEWILRNKTVFFDYPQQYRCMDMTERICINNDVLFLHMSVLSCILILMIILLSIVYKYRWFIRYQIYIWRHQPKLFQEMAERHFVYDIFVSYSAEDRDWVSDYLVPNLETDCHLRLCLHERDFQPGRSIIDNFVESMENSRHVLIILSNKFAKSKWYQFEMELAKKHVLNMYRESLTVVQLERIEAENVSNVLYAILQTTTFIAWNDNLEHIRLFWAKLKCAVQVDR